ncbi:enoyl-CoA hydratase/isomerase family protein [Kordiimonas sp. SCSIO 12610]|uniref:enoyl-CoA hydratase/isomerase family protein n=1 Tax=Kordiimonas sp. SCSIO 12610 TaxID=2829597 RepID=UPI00210D5D96|nr:enoyl-CoA hydratase-related protein [Kordiimonas sp. SCSIO 12610]UTW56476.1 enoyl-CoA hydratase/isomerase family protein [Kordiimonas sp. SCSIO 12610]
MSDNDQSLWDTSAPIHIAKTGAIGWIYINRPEKYNALKISMWQQIPACVAALDNDHDVRAIIITGLGGKAFSTGADIGDIGAGVGNPDIQEVNRLAIRNGQRALARARKPVIAMIDGLCIGGGCGLAIHCDVRFASERSRFAITPAKLGIVYPLNDTKELVDLVGPARAKMLLFSADQIDAQKAQEIGLIDELIPEEGLRASVLAFAGRISELSAFSIQHMKANIQAILDGQIDDDERTSNLFNDAHDADDGLEGFRAYSEKRKPDFKWNG